MSFIKKIIQNNLFKITTLNSVSVLVKIATGIITSKMLAIFVGPSGMALIGNLRNFTSSLENISTLGFQNGIVKYVGENEHDKNELNKIVSTVLITFLAVAFVLSLLILAFSDYLCATIFGNNIQYQIVFKAIAIVMPWSVISTLLVSVINGLGKYNSVFFANIITNIVCVFLSFVLIYFFKTVGAFFSIVAVPVVAAMITYCYFPKEIKIFQCLSFNYYDFKILKNFGGFSLMILPATILSPIFSLQIRNFLISNVGLNQSGLWEAITRISNLYLLFITTIVSVYFYPKLIKSNSSQEIKEVFLGYYKIILPVFIVGTVIIYFFRFYIVKIIFTDAFSPITDLFFWQLIGDVFKVAGMILGVFLMAQKRIFSYVFIEIGALIVLLCTSIFGIKFYGLEGVVIAHAFESIIYFLVLTVYFRKYLFFKQTF